MEEYGIKTVMDLRTVYPFRSFFATNSNTLRTEHANQVKKRQGDLKVPALVQSNAALAEPPQIPDVTYLNININGKGFERSLLWQLSTWSIM